jgi:hypothetical protein
MNYAKKQSSFEHARRGPAAEFSTTARSYQAIAPDAKLRTLLLTPAQPMAPCHGQQLAIWLEKSMAAVVQ